MLNLWAFQANYSLLAQAENTEPAPLFFVLLMLVVIIVSIIGVWKTFEKHDKPGWASIVPIYNVIVLAEIAGYNGLVGLLTMIPLVGIGVMLMLCIGVAKQSGRSTLFGLGIFFLPFIFYPILGFSND